MRLGAADSKKDPAVTFPWRRGISPRVPPVRAEAIDENLRDAAKHELQEAFHSTDRVVRAHALEAAGQLGEESATESILAAFDERNRSFASPPGWPPADAAEPPPGMRPCG